MKKKMAEVLGDHEEKRTTSGGGGNCFSLSRVFGKAHVHPSFAEAPHVAPWEYLLAMNDIWL
ncbi:hypothetical protein ACJRO7_023695 [Eucalyptus globulus]|uniref:Uncharacterized protein n=1 Tax=Eucalyptus globulus TaxID=34317 RepID=A0ABD3K3A3_EUCGL